MSSGNAAASRMQVGEAVSERGHRSKLRVLNLHARTQVQPRNRAGCAREREQSAEGVQLLQWSVQHTTMRLGLECQFEIGALQVVQELLKAAVPRMDRISALHNSTRGL
jgi:hypothetical protein